MLSSRMRTANFNGHLWEGGVSARGVCVQGLSLGGVVWLGGGVCPGCVCPGCVRPGGRVCTPPYPEADTPLPHCMLRYLPVNRMTDRRKNITLPLTSFAGGNYYIHLMNFVITYSDIERINYKIKD